MCPFCPRDEKASRSRGRGKLSRLPPRSLPGLRKEVVHSRPECSGRPLGARAAAALAGQLFAGTPPPSDDEATAKVCVVRRGPGRNRSLRRRRSCQPLAAWLYTNHTREPHLPPLMPTRLIAKASHVCDGSAPKSVTFRPQAESPVCSPSSRTPPGVDGGALAIGGVAAAELVRAHGSPLVVYDEATLRASTRLPRRPRPTRSSATGRRRFRTSRSCACSRRRGSARTSRLWASCGSRSGPASPASDCRPRQQQVRRGVARRGRGGRARRPRLARGDRPRTRRRRHAHAVRVTPGIEAARTSTIRTGHHGSKFGLPPDDALEALRRAPETEGLHAHVGSQLLDMAPR